MGNLRIYRGAYWVRPAVSRVGMPLTEPILTSAVFVTSDGTEILHALTTQHVYELVGSAWVQLTGPTLGASDYTQYSLTAWNDRLIFANGFDKISEVNNSSRTYAEIFAAPRARYVTTFGGRLVAGYVEGSPSRVQWSARNNNVDWTGLGSGYEDLLSTPGGVVDAVRGIFPISELDAIIVRARSIWLMRQTGDFLVPFRFDKMWDVTGTVSPWTFAITPKGLIGLFRDNVYLVSPSEPPKPIGNRIRDLIAGAAGLDYASGCFDVWRQEYCFTVPEASQTVVWRYNVNSDEDLWTRDVYNFGSKRIHSQVYRTAIGMDELAGSMETLAGPFELLGLGEHRRGVLFATGVANQTVVREDENATLDQSPMTSVADRGVGFEIWTGQLNVVSDLKGVHLVEIQVEYSSTRDVVLLAEVSSDGGDTWETYGGEVVARAFKGTRVVRFSVDISRSTLMLRLYSNNSVGFKLTGAHPRLAEGGEIAG